jgi:hypothetical protein
MASSGMLHRVGLVRNDVSEELSAYIISVTRRHSSLLHLCLIVSITWIETAVIVRFEVFTAVTMKNGVFWVVTPCGSCNFFAAYVGC